MPQSDPESKHPVTLSPAELNRKLAELLGIPQEGKIYGVTVSTSGPGDPNIPRVTYNREFVPPDYAGSIEVAINLATKTMSDKGYSFALTHTVSYSSVGSYAAFSKSVYPPGQHSESVGAARIIDSIPYAIATAAYRALGGTE